MNLAFRALIHGIEDVAKNKGVKNARVAYKRNKRGELVVALIIADQYGPFSPVSLELAEATSARAIKTSG
jgi:hypothetical protein